MKILLLLLTFFSFGALLSAEEVDFLGERHAKKFGTDCSGCHEETPPSKAVTMAVCIGCHGSLSEIGAKTELKELPNPHINHNDDLYCNDCHMGHKPPQMYCLQCHDFEYEVP